MGANGANSKQATANTSEPTQSQIKHVQLRMLMPTGSDEETEFN